MMLTFNYLELKNKLYYFHLLSSIVFISVCKYNYRGKIERKKGENPLNSSVKDIYRSKYIINWEEGVVTDSRVGMSWQ